METRLVWTWEGLSARIFLNVLGATARQKSEEPDTIPQEEVQRRVSMIVKTNDTRFRPQTRTLIASWMSSDVAFGDDLIVVQDILDSETVCAAMRALFLQLVWATKVSSGSSAMTAEKLSAGHTLIKICSHNALNPWIFLSSVIMALM